MDYAGLLMLIGRCRFKDSKEIQTLNTSDYYWLHNLFPVYVVILRKIVQQSCTKIRLTCWLKTKTV